MKSFLQKQPQKEDTFAQEIKNTFNLYKCGNFCKSFALETEMHKMKIKKNKLYITFTLECSWSGLVW